MSEVIINTRTTVEEINSFIHDRLGPAVAGQSLALVNASFLTLLITNQGPDDITIDEISAGVLGASGYICTYLSSLRGPQTVN